MGSIWLVAGLLFTVAWAVCHLVLLVEAFKEDVWKGAVGLVCGLYLLYFAIAELEHDYKWPLILGWLFAGGIGGKLLQMGLPMPR